MVVGRVEADDLRVVSFVCTKGRHRSVAAAEIFVRLYYPLGRTVHLTIV